VESRFAKTESDMLWDDLRYFLAVTRAHNLTDAGRHLRVSASTVSRRVDTLERALGQRLFRRHRGGYTLTPAGERLVGDAEAVEARILSLQRNAGAVPDDVAGVVRVATPELLAHELIVPRLGGFCETYPALSLELLPDVRPVSLAREEADIALRAVRPTQGAYTLRRLAQVAVGLFASESYVVRYGTPDSCTDLSRHRLVAWDHDLAFLQMARWLATIAGDARVVLRTSTFTAQLGACRAGCGLAALPVMSANATACAGSPTKRRPCGSIYG
jgi:DNA-binding transcriptional LysR family regulator